MLDRLHGLTSKLFGVNFIVSPLHLQGGPNRPPLDLHCIEIAARSATVVKFFYDEPDARLVQMVHAGGALAAWQVGSLEEAIAADAAGCDFVVAQGIGAGGHVRGTIGTFPLLEEVLDAIGLPVLVAANIVMRS